MLYLNATSANSKVMKTIEEDKGISGIKKFHVKTRRKNEVQQYVYVITSKLLKMHYRKNIVIHTDPIDDRQAFKLIEMSKAGLPYEHFSFVMSSCKFKVGVWPSVLNISERTFQDYKANKKTLNTFQSENVLGLTVLYDKGISVFGSEEKFIRWINTPNKAMGGITPYEIIDTRHGQDTIEIFMKRIQVGVVA